MIGWAVLGALADVVCGMAIALGAGLVGYGLARRLYRVARPRFPSRSTSSDRRSPCASISGGLA